MATINITRDLREGYKITSTDVGKVLAVSAAGVLEPVAVADVSQLAEADENKVLIVNADGLPEGYFPASGKVGVLTDAGFVEVTPIADGTHTVAVGDVIAFSNGIITSITPA